MTQALPALGAHVVITPLLRTVRNTARQPELDARGEPKKQLATVYIDGQKIEQPTRVKVTIAVIRQLRAGNLSWQSVLEHTREQRAKRCNNGKAELKTDVQRQAEKVSVEKHSEESASAETTAAPVVPAKPAASRAKKSQEQTA